MPSPLQSKLGPERWEKLVEHAIDRALDLIHEREGSDWWTRRERYELLAAMDYSHRKAGEGKVASIFDKSNVGVPIVRSCIRFMQARLSKDVFGSKPFMSIKPQGPTDGILSDQIQKHAGWKLEEARYSIAAKEGLSVALDLGEVAIKTTWEVEEDTFERQESHLIDKTTGEPVVGQDGERLLDTADTVEGIATLPDGSEIETRFFVSAPEVEIPAPHNNYEWKDEAVEETVRLYSRPKCVPIYWKDVFWSMNAPCLDESDMVVHRYDTTGAELRRRFSPNGEKNADLEALIELLSAEGNDPKSEATKERIGEPRVQNTDPDRSVFQVLECYWKADVFGDGRMSRVWAVVHPEHRVGIWGDYTATISPRGQTPIHLMPVNKVPGRAYGRGMYELYEMAAEKVDELANSILYRTRQNANAAKFINPSHLEGGKVNLGPDATNVLKSNQMKANEILQFVEIPDLDERTWQLMELFMQLIQTESGVTNANQGDTSGLPSNTTATGINSMLESSSVLHLYTLDEIKDWLTPQLRYVVELIYFKQDRDETYEYLEGDADAVLTLSQAQVLRKLPLNVEILLSRAKRQEQRESAFAAIPITDAYYDQLAQTPVGAQALIWKAVKTLPLRIQALRGLDIDNADKNFPTEGEIMEAIAQQQAAQDAAMQAQGGMEGEMVEEPTIELPSNVIPDAAPV